MVKGSGKSSASSGTRKKHARKAAAVSGTDGQAPPPPVKPKKEKGEKGGKKGSSLKKEPRQKVYIPPVKPAPPQPDPLETTGLAHRLPPELLVVLRSLGKKSEATKTKALEDLQMGWVDRKEQCEEALVDMVPVWLHHIPALFIHPSRRIRSLASTLHNSFLKIPSIKHQIIFSLTESLLNEHQISSIVGTWCIITHDIDRTVASIASESWRRDIVPLLSSSSSSTPSDNSESNTSSSSSLFLLKSIDTFIRRAILDPISTYASLNPSSLAPPTPALTPRSGPGGKKGQTQTRPGSKYGSGGGGRTSLPMGSSPNRSGTETPEGGGERSKADLAEESETDRKARIRVGGLGGLRWILDHHPRYFTSNPETTVTFFSNHLFWSILHPSASPPFLSHSGTEGEGFGVSQPIVRRTGWGLIQSVLKGFKDEPLFDSSILPIMSTAILRSAFVETDVTVQMAMWQPFLVFLRNVRRVWEVEVEFESRNKYGGRRREEEDERDEDDGEDDDEEEEEEEGDQDDEEEERKVKPETESGKDQRQGMSSRKLESRAYQEFLRFLELGCSGSPVQGYPTAVVILSSIPSEIFASPSSSSTTTPLSDLFTSFWAAIDGRALSLTGSLPHQRLAAANAFLSSVLECMVFLVRRVWKELESSSNEDQEHNNEERSAGKGKHAELLLPASEADGSEGPDAYKNRLRSFVSTQIGRVWEELSSEKRSLKVEDRVAAELLERTLVDLVELDLGLFESAWETLKNGMKESAKTNRGLVPVVLEVFLRKGGFGGSGGSRANVGKDRNEKGMDERRERRNKCREVLEKSAREVLREVFEGSVDECERYLKGKVERDGDRDEEDGDDKEEKKASAEKPEALELLVVLLRTFGGMVFEDEERINALVTSHGYALLSKSSTLLTAYVVNQKDEKMRADVWQRLLREIAARHSNISGSETSAQTITLLFSQLLDVLAQIGDTNSQSLRPEKEELDGLVEKLLIECMNDSATATGSGQVSALKKILTRPAPILSESGYQNLIQSLASAFSLQIDSALRSKDVSVLSFHVVLDLLSVALVTSRDESLVLGVMPDIFLLAGLFPKLPPGTSPGGSQDHGVFAKAQKVWDEWSHDNEGVYVQVKERLKEVLIDTQVRFSPNQIVQALSELSNKCPIDPIHELLPSRTELDAILDSLSPDPIDPSLAVLDPLIPPSSFFTTDEGATDIPFSCDSNGCSSYARLVIALVHVVLQDRQIAKDNMWILRHLLSLSLYTEDLINVPEAKSPVFSKTAVNAGTAMTADADGGSGFDLSELVLKIQQIVTYVLTSVTSERWRQSALDVSNGKGSVDSLAVPHARFLVDIAQLSQRADTSRECRVLYNVLQHALDDIEKDEADSWILFARRIEKTAPETCMTVVSAISRSAPEPPRLERYRNELAASLLGIPPSKADTEGLLALRKLASAAPDADSDVAFLPPQRAVNVVKSCEQWASSDEDISEEVECAMTLTFFHLAPILQNVPGAHWAFIFDVVENNLENSSMADESTLVTLSRTLRLVTLIRDLAATNKGLRADWVERETAILTLIRNLATSQLESRQPSAPGSACRELILSIVQDLPATLIDHETLPKMCHLLLDPSVDVQKMAYQLLQQAAKKRTEHLVIEAGVDTVADFKAELPLELMVILEQTSNFEPEDGEQDQNLFGHLLGWMLLFDLFIDTSLKVRVSYIDQLRSSSIIETYFIPTIFNFLELDKGIARAFKLDKWAVDEYFVHCYEPGPSHSFSLKVLAAHLYYRALLTIPSLIHNWALDCKDRSLSSTVATYTSTHFSPLIIKAEIAQVKSAQTTSELVDESLAIKVANLTNEVAASYSVDEHQLEIRLKIPSDWPLHKIEIKDVKRVGVDENRWRAWILAIQQTLWAQNGRIVDGLALFKKNVTLHFEGQVECAICYSIISVMDGTLPKKPCKTCKNRFHAACLYKWFSSSHSSSCPLCRSDILH
ncbi:hypothetical protein K435DRAFT_710473 [Dendrothele bispora CBS 962.96]|uniref:E3 ubiquitin-protein ligase listerin n=1 Tax=Dendrothele bispora (strain CBS 962.96) TaxID=1314807 RepID=A0A4V4HIM6_DENBC|nr:hypothetical protein K435DRAFT_710473 [Dendrothele bispora CBS 962.96]